MATGTITSLGIGSDLDLQGMLDTLQEADEAIADLTLDDIEEQQAIEDELNSVLNQLLSMKTTVLDLSLSSTYLTRSVTSSNEDVATVTVQDGTDTGSHRVETTRIAASSSYISTGYASESSVVYVPTTKESTDGYESSDIVLAEGETLEISYGDEDDPVTITITAGEGGYTAQALAEAVNSATENQDGDGEALVVASTYIDDEDGLTHIRIEAASDEGGEENRVSVSSANAGLSFSTPTSELSFTVGDGETYTISVPAETTLEDLAERINEDEDNPGVTATVIYTGVGDNPYQLVIEADDSGEDSRISIVSAPEGLTLSEKSGDGYAMTADTAISFDTAVTVDDTNNTIVFSENGGDELTATIAKGDYETADELAEAVEAALENESQANGEGVDYQVTINEDTGIMTISEAGTLEEMTISWEDEDSTASSLLGFSSTRTITPFESSLNAEIIVDGVTYQRQGNETLSDIIDGVSLTLYGTGTATITVENDTDTIDEELASLVEMYNTLLTEIDENDDYDEDEETWGALARSATARNLKQDLQDLFSTVIDTGGSITSLLDIGFEFDDDGTLSLDEDTLSQVLAESYDDVVDLLLGTDSVTGIADTLNDAIGSYALSDGYIQTEIDGVEEKIERLEESYETEMERIEKKYDTLADQYSELDTYLAEIESIQSYIDTMMSTDSDD